MIHIVSDNFKSEELRLLLEAEAQSLDLQLVKEPENTMALDPFSLALMAGTGAALAKILPTIVKGLFAVWEKKNEAKSKLDLATLEAKGKLETSMVKIKIDAKEIEIPYGSSPETVNSILQEIEGKNVKQIALITEA